MSEGEKEESTDGVGGRSAVPACPEVTYGDGMERCDEAGLHVDGPIDQPRWVTVTRRIGNGEALLFYGAPSYHPIKPDLYSSVIAQFTFLVPATESTGDSAAHDGEPPPQTAQNLPA